MTAHDDTTLLRGLQQMLGITFEKDAELVLTNKEGIRSVFPVRAVIKATRGRVTFPKVTLREPKA